MTIRGTLLELHQCALAVETDTRLVGNVRAGDIVEACSAGIRAIEASGRPPALSVYDDLLEHVADEIAEVSTRGVAEFDEGCARLLGTPEGKRTPGELLKLAAEAVYYARCLGAGGGA